MIDLGLTFGDAPDLPELSHHETSKGLREQFKLYRSFFIAESETFLYHSCCKSAFSQHGLIDWLDIASRLVRSTPSAVEPTHHKKAPGLR